MSSSACTLYKTKESARSLKLKESQVYLFPIAAVTNYHKVSGLKQHTCIHTVLEIRNPELILRADNQGTNRQGYFPSEIFQEEYAHLFEILKSVMHVFGSRLYHSSLCFCCHITFLLILLLLPPLYKDSYHHTESLHLSQDSSACLQSPFYRVR